MASKCNSLNDIKNQFNVLDHGFIRLVDYMGSDSRVVQAARVSTGAGVKTPQEDRNLIRYMLRHKHTTPFEKVRFEFHVKLPIFVARQWIRHRTGSFNELSARYSELPTEFYVPNEFRKQGTSNKQGGEDTFSGIENERLKNTLITRSFEAFQTYNDMLSKGVSRELARLILPVNTYTAWYWTVDLHNLFHFLALRLDSHAQYEIREYAEVIASIISHIVPDCWQAFNDYRLNSVTFTGPEVKYLDGDLKLFINPQCDSWDGTPDAAGTEAAMAMSSREHSELLDKLDSMGVENISDW